LTEIPVADAATASAILVGVDFGLPHFDAELEELGLLAQTAGLHPDRPVTPLPGPLPALLGLAGFAGTVVPVYDLAALLGHPEGDRPRWLVLASGLPPLGLAFHELDGHVRVAAGTIVAEQAREGPRGCLRGMVELDGTCRPIVDVPATRTQVHTLAGHVQVTEEAQR